MVSYTDVHFYVAGILAAHALDFVPKSVLIVQRGNDAAHAQLAVGFLDVAFAGVNLFAHFQDATVLFFDAHKGGSMCAAPNGPPT